MVTMASTVTQEVFGAEIINFLFLHGFFELKKTSEDLPQCGQKAADPLTKDDQQCLQEAFHKALDRMASYRPEHRSKKDIRPYLKTLHDAVQFAEDLLKHPDVVQPIKGFSEEVQEEWDKLLQVVDKLKGKHKADELMSDSYAFELLFLQLGLLLFSDPEATMSILQDLHVCHNKAFQRKRRASMKKGDTEPEWMEVIIEMLLSLLSKGSHLVRTVINKVFPMFCPHLTTKSLAIILDALRTSPGDEDDEDKMLGFEEEIEEMENNESNEGEMEMAEDNDEEEEDSDSSSDEDDDDEEEDMETEEDLAARRAVIKAALGPAAADSDAEESEEDLDDEAMFKQDALLAAAFKSLQKGKKPEEQKAMQLRHFRMRCLDLLTSVIASDPPVGLMLELVKPLMELMDAGDKDKHARDLQGRAMNIFNRLCKPRKLAPDPEFDRADLPNMVSDLIQYSTKVSGVAMVKHVASACLLVIRVMLGMENNSGPSPIKTRAQRKEQKQLNEKDSDCENMEKVLDIIQEGLTKFCEKRNSHLDHNLFKCMLERQKLLLWPVAEHLLTLGVRDDVRIFCKRQVWIMLELMPNKGTPKQIGQEAWQDFATQVVEEVSKMLEKLAGQENLKHSVVVGPLKVLHKALSLSDATVRDQLPVPDHLEKTLTSLKEMFGSTEAFNMCKRIINIISKGAPQENQGSKKKDKKKKKRALENSEEQEIETQSKKKKLTNGTAADGDLSGEATLGDTGQMSEQVEGGNQEGTEPSESGKKKSSKKKKKRKSSLEKTDLGESFLTMGESDAMEIDSATPEENIKSPKHKNKSKKACVDGPEDISDANQIKFNIELAQDSSSSPKTPKKKSKHKELSEMDTSTPKHTPGKTPKKKGPKTPNV